MSSSLTQLLYFLKAVGDQAKQKQKQEQMRSNALLDSGGKLCSLLSDILFAEEIKDRGKKL